MFNFITQQRRGTTEEWSESTVIPKAGEFVIEERKNAPTRIKLGDGVHRFNDLQYIDDATVSALTDLEARYDAHVAYIEGGSPVPDSTLATEVLDARFIDGVSYASLNAAIQGVSDKRVGGMVYDYEGELGLKQPYMLYLTDKDNNIIEETGVRIISGAGGGGGGGGSSFGTLTVTRVTPDPFYVTVNEKATIKFNFSGVDSSGEAITHATATWKVDGKVVGYQEVVAGENKYTFEKLKIGKSKIFLSVVDDAGSVATKTWEANNIELKVESTFDDKRYYDFDKYLVFTCSPYGAVDKEIHIILDNEEFTDTLSAATSGDTYPWEFPKLSHGSHYLHVYTKATINSEPHYSNHIYKDVLIRDPASNIPLIGCSTQTIDAKQYETVNVEYYVYDPTNENPVVNIYVDDELVSTRTLSSNRDIYTFQSSVEGDHTVKISCSNMSGATTEKIIQISVKTIGVVIAPVTGGLVFDFNPVGHSNEDISENIAWSNDNIHMIVSDNFDWENGGFKFDKDIDNRDIPGSYHFCVKAGTTATIDYELFGDEAKQLGKEAKIIFKVSNVVDLSKTMISCFDSTVNVGLQMSPQEASVQYQGGAVNVAYSEDDIIEYEFNITPGSSAVPMVMCYEDGVSTRPSVYSPESHNFTQKDKKYITIGSDSCDINIYRFKVYQKSLESKEILQNFIADGRTPDEIISRFVRNQIYDEDTKILTPESLSNACPNLRVYKISAPVFTNDKKDKVTNTTIQQLYKAGDPVLDNWVAYNCMHSGQGTSSNEYGPAGRNLDFIMNSSGLEDDLIDPKQVYIELGDGTITDKITLTRTSVPVNYLNAKVNIASSNNVTNALLARHYNRNNPYRRPFIRKDSELIPYIKDTMEFYNCAIFIQETDPVRDADGNYVNHREFNDTEWHFYAIGNIGDSKKTDKTRLTDIDDPYECCIEIMDVGKPLSGFPRDTMMNAMSIDSKTGKYIWATQENLNKKILFEKQADGSYSVSNDTAIDTTKTYYVDILENDDFSEDYTYGWRYISDDENPEVVNYCKQKWIEFYRFLTTSSDEEFKQNFGNYFVQKSALYNYLFTLRYCMVDNRAKNTFWHYGKTGEVDSDGNPIRKWDLCWDYDNDTSLGLNNSGVQAYRYGLEDTDRINGSEVFRQSESTFFNRIRENFRAELAELYNTLDNSGSGTWNAQSLIAEADTMQSEFPEDLWRLDIERKYIRTYTKSFINGGPWQQGLTQMCNGRMKYHRRQWERSQEQYMASKFITNAMFNDSTAISLRGPAQELKGPDYEVVKPNYQFTLTPRLYTYLNVRYGTTDGDIKTERVTQPGQPITLRYDGTYNDLLYIGNGKSLSDLGDLSSFYLEKVTLGNAPYLRNLTLGNATTGYKNTHFEEWSSGNPLLETLNMENVVWKDTVNKSLNLKDMLSLKSIKAFGSNTTSIDFAAGCKLNDVELPKTLTSLTFKKLRYLTTDKIKLEPSDKYSEGDYSSILDLTVEDCPKINAITLRGRCTNLQRLRLTDVVFGTTTYDYFKNNIFDLKGIDGSGNVTDHAWITGTAHFDHLTGTQLQELKTRYPHLEVTYNTLECTVQFKLDVNSEVVYTHSVTSYNNVLVSVEDPVKLGMIEKPIKESTISHTYEYAGWSTEPNGIPVEPSPLIQVDSDMILYPTFKESIRQYKVSFYNNDGSLLNSYDVDYGTSYFEYPDKEPDKAGTINPDAYTFSRWNPAPENITGDLSCYAVYELKPEAIYTLKLTDFEYEQNTDQKTLHITNYINETNKIIRIADTYTVDGDSYTVTQIGGFKSKSIEYVELPSTLVILDAYAFSGNKDITTIIIPEFVTEIGAGAFEGCTGLADVYYNAVDATAVRVESNDSYVFNNTFSKSGYTVHVGNKVKKIPSYLFAQGTNVTETSYAVRKIVFKEESNCETLGSYAFWKTHCENVTFPTSLRTIEQSAFEYGEFTSIELPVGLTTIDADAFSHCAKLTSMYIPKSVQMISSAALRYSLNVDLEIEDGSRFVWKDYCLVDTTEKKLLMGRANSIIPDNLGITSIADHCFTEVGIETVTVPEGVTRIGQYAFYNCTKLVRLELPNTLTQLESFAIYGCAFTELRLPQNLQSIGTFALVDNFKLLEISIPASVRSIGYRALRGCTKLEKVTFECGKPSIPKPNDADYDLFLYDENLVNIIVNWTHAEFNEDAPWSAGTNSNGSYINPVTVTYTDKKLVYNTDGTVTEEVVEMGD